MNLVALVLISQKNPYDHLRLRLAASIKRFLHLLGHPEFRVDSGKFLFRYLKYERHQLRLVANSFVASTSGPRFSVIFPCLFPPFSLLAIYFFFPFPFGHFGYFPLYFCSAILGQTQNDNRILYWSFSLLPPF